MVHLDQHSVSRIVPQFHEYLAREGQQQQEERASKDEFFARYFARNQLPKIDEGILRDLILKLWAFAGWTNKDYLLQEMLASGLDKIRAALDYLLYSDDPIPRRFDRLRSEVRMMGAASVSEILAHHDHTRYPMWNNRSKAALITLGVPDALLPKSTQISGSQYKQFCDVVAQVRDQLAPWYPEFRDLLNLNLLLFYLSLQKPVQQPSSAIAPRQADAALSIEDFDHDSVVSQVLELGDGLGFEVQREVSITHGCKIDAIWRSRVGNLGTIAYAFEVHRKGSRDSAILNLQKVSKDATIQKVVIVSSGTELNKFRDEISPLFEHFRNSVGYFSVSDLQIALDHLQALKDTMKVIGLLSMGPRDT